MSIPQGHKSNFQTLQAAFDNNDVALMECTDKAGKSVYVICATFKEEDGTVVFTPFAKLFDGNPYDELNPPSI